MFTSLCCTMDIHVLCKKIFIERKKPLKRCLLQRKNPRPIVWDCRTLSPRPPGALCMISKSFMPWLIYYSNVKITVVWDIESDKSTNSLLRRVDMPSSFWLHNNKPSSFLLHNTWHMESKWFSISSVPVSVRDKQNVLRATHLCNLSS